MKIRELNQSQFHNEKKLEFWNQRTDVRDNITDGLEWIESNLSYFQENQNFLEDSIGTLEGEVLELGAGHCWLTAYLSTLESVDQVHAVEQSERLITEMAPQTIDYIDGRVDKIDLYLGDFNNLEYFYEREFDIVILDSAFHHAEYPSVLLAEIRKVLADDGSLILFREPMLSGVDELVFKLSEEHTKIFDERFSREKENERNKKRAKSMGCPVWGTENRYYLRDYSLLSGISGYDIDVVFSESISTRGSGTIPFSYIMTVIEYVADGNWLNNNPWQIKKIFSHFFSVPFIILQPRRDEKFIS